MNPPFNFKLLNFEIGKFKPNKTKFMNERKSLIKRFFTFRTINVLLYIALILIVIFLFIFL